MNRREFLTTSSALLYYLLATDANGEKKELSRFVWDDTYSFNWTNQPPYSLLKNEQVVPIDKFQKLHDTLSEKQTFSKPYTLTQTDLLEVHSPQYLDRLNNLIKTGIGILNGENPINQQILNFAIQSCAGTYTAARIALQQGISMNLSGGFHHAFPDHEEGFCYLNDIAIAITKLRSEKDIKKAMIIDCDVHHGNGNAYFFIADPQTYILDIYQEDNHYPGKNNRFEPDKKINLLSSDNITDMKYLDAIKNNLQKSIKIAKPDIAFYLAGADPYKDDKLGNFQLTKTGLKQRDEYILRNLRKHNIPTVVVLAGGYARNIEDVVDIHRNTADIVRRI